MSGAGRPSTRVVVIGAGAAGLAAAAALCRRGLAVTVLEGRDRLGGRIDTRADARLGLALEHGAEFVHGRPERTLALARLAGAKLVELPDRHLRRRGARLADGRAAFAKGQELLGRGARDDQPIAALLRGAGTAGPRGAAASMGRELVRGFYLSDPRTASALALGRMSRALEELEGDVTSRVDGGYARVLAPLVRTVRARGAVRLATVVEEIRWRRGEVRVLARGAAGGRLAPVVADRAVVTLPVSILGAGAVRFSPSLPEKRGAARALPMGPLVKVLLRFREAPWMNQARTRGLVFLHVGGAPVPVFWTLAPIDAPVLAGWAGGPDAARLAGLREEAVLRAALRSAARGLGREAGDLEERLDGAAVVDWTGDPFARGGYATFPVGSAGAPEALARSVEGTLFFAGEATAGAHAGTVEGALRSGDRAAREVLEAG